MLLDGVGSVHRAHHARKRISPENILVFPARKEKPTPTPMSSKFRHVHYRWDDAAAAKLDPVGRLIYRSNILGSDQRITNTGGGNTSAKIMETDPLTGEPTEVLWVKGSGGDLRTSTARKLLLALPGQAARSAEALRRASRRPARRPTPRTTWWACTRTPPSI